MVKLTPEMIEAFNSTKYFAMATSSKGGDPNVVPIGMAIYMDPETVWIGNQFFHQTIMNVKENPRVALLVWTPGVPGCLKVKGDVTVLESGPDYEKMKGMVKERKPTLNCKGLLIMKITDVFDCRSGAEAGKRLL
ncbi:MAG: pyridoxamine 5'-phosphate oxidase family protein [Methanomassiliicoccales archaeon]|nr:pyridoxamine 5'-phosphate oxidase family protein [Methanomassiliicoccales archaeon]